MDRMIASIFDSADSSTCTFFIAPMPGSILAVNVKPGDSFRSGQVLLILEAMKMENEIMAPCDGKVVSVSVQSGTSVNSGDVLIAYV